MEIEVSQLRNSIRTKSTRKGYIKLCSLRSSDGSALTLHNPMILSSRPNIILIINECISK